MPARPGERRLQILQTLATMLEAPRGERITTAALAAKQVSALELATLFLDRIERLNPTLNAFVTTDRDKTLAMARAADEPDRSKSSYRAAPAAKVDSRLTGGSGVQRSHLRDRKRWLGDRARGGRTWAQRKAASPRTYTVDTGSLLGLAEKELPKLGPAAETHRVVGFAR